MCLPCMQESNKESENGKENPKKKPNLISEFGNLLAPETEPL